MSGYLWVGNYSGAIVVHQNCPFNYCKSAFKDVLQFAFPFYIMDNSWLAHFNQSILYQCFKMDWLSIIHQYSHHKPLHWVNKFKPLLDAYQGPYRAKPRYWTGLLLLARLVILTAVSFNVSRNKAINLIVIIVILTVNTDSIQHKKAVSKQIGRFCRVVFTRKPAVIGSNIAIFNKAG